MAQGIPQRIASLGQVVAHQRAAVVAAAGEEADVVLALGFDVGRDLPVDRQGPDGGPRAHGDAAGGAGQALGLIEMRKAQLQLTPVAAHAHHPSGLVGGEQRRQGLAVLVAHLNGLEPRGWLELGWGFHESNHRGLGNHRPWMRDHAIPGWRDGMSRSHCLKPLD